MRGGYSLRSSISGTGGPGQFRVLQGGDLRPDGVVWDSLGWAELGSAPEKYLVADGDVLLPLRGDAPRAAVVRNPPDGVVVAGHWALISPDTNVIDPEYLAWYLSHPATAARLSGSMRGTKLKFLSLTDLRDFDVVVPPLAHQRRIVRVHKLNERVSALESQLATARRTYIDAVTMSALGGVVNPDTATS